MAVFTEIYITWNGIIHSAILLGSNAISTHWLGVIASLKDVITWCCRGLFNYSNLYHLKRNETDFTQSYHLPQGNSRAEPKWEEGGNFANIFELFEKWSACRSFPRAGREYPYCFSSNVDSSCFAALCSSDETAGLQYCKQRRIRRHGHKNLHLGEH